MEIFQVLLVVLQVYKFVKTHRTIHLKRVDFIVYEPDLNTKQTKGRGVGTLRYYLFENKFQRLLAG